ncbi:transcription factor TFIIIC subunit tfc4 [Mortierella claussenii]|nr:transcription factor TFIIIC subunit tfc4 [Mortierella claussenii]
MDFDHKDDQEAGGAYIDRDHRSSSGESGSSSRHTTNDDAAHDILANLEVSFQSQHTATNPLLARLTQNSAERAHVVEVSHQLGPEDTRAPKVIGDFVGLNNRPVGLGGGGGFNGRASLNEAMEHIRLGGEDDEYNELDGDEVGDEDAAMDFDQDLNLQTEGTRRTVIEEDPWDKKGGGDPTMDDDDDELDENDPAMEELGFALAPKSKREKKKMSRKGVPVYPPEIQKLLGMANAAYVNRDYKQAVDLYQQVIVTHPSVFQAWNIMGVIQEELGNTEKALQLYLVAAHLTPKDGALWKKLAVISKNCGYDQQALYCFSRAFRADKHDMDALWDRSIMYQILNEPFKAIQGFQRLLKVKQHYMPALEELVKIYSSLDQDNKRYREYMHQAMVDYEAAYLHYSSIPDRFANASGDPFDITEEPDNQEIQTEAFGYSALNMLSELYIMFDEYEKPINMIKTWSRRLQKRSHQTWWDDYKDDREFDTDPDDEELQASLGENRTRGLPVDLRVKLGICRLMMEEVKEAKAQFRYLWKCSVEDFPDLYEEIAELYISKRMWKEGYNVIRAMLQFDEMDIPKIWIMAGECLRNLDRLKDAKDYLEQAHRADPASVDVSMMLAEVYEEMGNLPQALTMVNYVRKANAEKQAENDKRRREARMAKANKSGSSRGQTSDALDSAPQPYLQSEQSSDPRFRQIAPRPKSVSTTWHLGTDAARGALERIAEAGRSKSVAERYSAADRDRDIQLVRSAREQERAYKLAERDVEMKDVVEKFNKLDLIIQRIDEKEKSRVWTTKQEAVKMTREDRTQYIQVARDLINVFRSNRGFFPKEKHKPYTGVESRAWRSRRNAADADTVLSEHASEMADRLARLMGMPTASEQPTAPEQASEVFSLVKTPLTFRDVSFDAWYLLMIRQAVYLTYEDRYTEAVELLMLMFSANVFYSFARRRSGIMMVLLACAMWATDHGAVINAGRWLALFGGLRPFPFKIFQATFTTGPRGNKGHFVWAQNITHKFTKRHVLIMRRAVGKGQQRLMRKIPLLKRKRRRPALRGPNKAFRMLPPTLASPKKKHKLDYNRTPGDKRVSFPWRTISDVLVSNIPDSQTQGTQGRGSTEDQRTPAGASDGDNLQTSTPLTPKESDDGLLRRIDTEGSSLGGDGDDPDPTADSVSTQKRRLLVDADGTEDADTGAEDAEEDDQLENDDDDDYDVNDELYKTEDEEEDDDDGEIEWENDNPKFTGPKSFGKRSSNTNLNEYDDEDEDDDESPRRGPSKGYRSRTTGEGGLDPDVEKSMPRKPKGRTNSRMYTKEMYPQFHVHMTMFLGFILAQSRSHVGSATQFAECMSYAPYNPMIQFYLATQFLNLSMQRTTPNRQMATAQALTFLQNYYRLRSAGYGTVAMANREKEYKAKNIPAPRPPISPVFSIVGAEPTNWKAQAAKISAEGTEASGAKSSPALAPTVAPTTASKAAGEISEEKRKEGEDMEDQKHELEQDRPLRHCQQEAEYNFARAMHQMGQNQLAMVHYQRVLELPSWREVEREQEAARKQEIALEKERMAQMKAEARALALERKMKRAEEIRELRAAKHVDALKAKTLRSAQQGISGVGKEDNKEEEDDVDEDDEEVEEYSSAEEEVDEGQENGGAGAIPRLQLEDVDSTDLKREAAFNLAKIYMQSGAMGEAQLLIREYCTI